MTVYVDDLEKTHRTKRWPFDGICHMIADSEDELLSFGESIGLMRIWARRNNGMLHFNLSPAKRIEALQAGAEQISEEDLQKRMQEYYDKTYGKTYI